MPTPEASVATSNNLSKSGSRRTGAVVRATLICWKARSAEALHSKQGNLSSSVSGAAKELKFLTNLR